MLNIPVLFRECNTFFENVYYFFKHQKKTPIIRSVVALFSSTKKAPILNRCLNYHLLINLYTRKYTTHEYTNIQRFFHCFFFILPVHPTYHLHHHDNFHHYHNDPHHNHQNMHHHFLHHKMNTKMMMSLNFVPLSSYVFLPLP